MDTGQNKNFIHPKFARVLRDVKYYFLFLRLAEILKKPKSQWEDFLGLTQIADEDGRLLSDRYLCDVTPKYFEVEWLWN